MKAFGRSIIWLVLALALLSPLRAWAAAYTSTLTGGDWSVSATWGGAGVPGAGDTANVYGPVTVDVDTTVGVSGASNSTDVNVFGSAQGKSGALTIAAGKKLTAKCSLNCTNVTITLSAGSTITFDSSTAADPPNTHYRVYGASGTKIATSGTGGGSHATWNSAGAGQGQGFSDCQFDCSYTDFSNQNRMGVDIQASGRIGRFINCTFANVPVDMQTALIDGVTVRFEGCTWSSMGSGLALSLANQAPTAMTTGDRTITKCVFDGAQMTLYAPQDFTITDTYFNAGFVAFGSQVGKWATFARNMCYTTVSQRYTMAGDITNSYCIVDENASGNPHFFQVQQIPTSEVCDGNIFHYTGNFSDGDCFLVGDSGGSAQAGGPFTLTLTHNIVLPNGASSDSGTLFTHWGRSTSSTTANHNTYISGNQGPTVGEIYAGYAGILASFKSNIGWNPSVTANGFKLRDIAGSPVTNTALSANLDYNAGYHFTGGSAGSNLKGYDGFVFSSGSPGAHDLADQDPQFVASTRNELTWDTSLGGAGTIASVLARIKADPTLTYTSLIPYVQAGFAPRNTALRAAGHDGADIGAVAGQFGIFVRRGSNVRAGSRSGN